VIKQRRAKTQRRLSIVLGGMPDDFCKIV